MNTTHACIDYSMCELISLLHTPQIYTDVYSSDTLLLAEEQYETLHGCAMCSKDSLSPIIILALKKKTTINGLIFETVSDIYLLPVWGR